MRKKKKIETAKTVFITFSGRAYIADKTFYKKFIKAAIKGSRHRDIYPWTHFIDAQNTDDIHQKSLSAIRRADLIVVEASQSSTGVGQQIAYAINKKKPIFLCLRETRRDKSQNRFLKGTRVALVNFIYYKSLDDFQKKLAHELSSLPEVQLEKFNFISTRQQKKVIIRESKKYNISQSELLRGIIDNWIKQNHIK